MTGQILINRKGNKNGFDRFWNEEKSTPPNKEINVIKLSSVLN
ncbi:25897_t:CDS:2, partial [Racocetra persica]